VVVWIVFPQSRLVSHNIARNIACFVIGKTANVEKDIAIMLNMNSQI
jgi:hypothetical protein